jgi:hypothetical protein
LAILAKVTDFGETVDVNAMRLPPWLHFLQQPTQKSLKKTLLSISVSNLSQFMLKK